MKSNNVMKMRLLLILWRVDCNEWRSIRHEPIMRGIVVMGEYGAVKGVRLSGGDV